LAVDHFAADHSEMWQFASQLEGHLTEVEDWDLGAGIYIEFLTLKSSFMDTSNPAEGLVRVLFAGGSGCSLGGFGGGGGGSRVDLGQRI
jgi:hypothetical protein